VQFRQTGKIGQAHLPEIANGQDMCRHPVIAESIEHAAEKHPGESGESIVGRLLCGLTQSSLYNSTTGILQPTPSPMQIPRLGHTSLLMGDGTVLIAGGIGNETVGASTTIVVIRDLEVFNPRTAVPPYDANTGLDVDDPFYDELRKTGTVREPGKEAVVPDKPAEPVRLCGTL
jgi:hypothetical protein